MGYLNMKYKIINGAVNVVNYFFDKIISLIYIQAIIQLSDIWLIKTDYY